MIAPPTFLFFCRLLDKEKTREKVKVYPWILQKRGIDMQPIVSAPTPLRNKCEFTFGYRYLFDPETQSVDTAVSSSTAATGAETEPKAADDVVPKRVPAVGFMVTGWAGGVCFSNALKNIPSEACAIVDAVNEFLTTSPLEPYDSKAHRGFWRILTMRTSRRTQECMIVIQHSPPCKGGYGDHESYDCTKEFAIERDRLVQVLTRAELPNDEQEEQKVKVTSIFFQEFGGLSNPTPDHPVQVSTFEYEIVALPVYENPQHDLPLLVN